jgi:hypothetical protein
MPGEYPRTHRGPPVVVRGASVLSCVAASVQLGCVFGYCTSGRSCVGSGPASCGSPALPP